MKRLCTLILLAGSAVAAPILPGLAHIDEPSVRGQVLIAELNCLACHAGGQLGKPAPRLARVGNRLSPDNLRNYLADAHLPRQALSPSETESIVAYLAGLQGPTEPATAGNPSAGSAHYHQVGCVACHAPQPGVRPIGMSDDQELPSPTDSVPLQLSRLYPPSELAAFLRNPQKLRPGGRMPSLKLSAQEAADIASYLSQAPTPPRAEARPEPAVYRQRCASCHEQAKPSAKPLSALTHTACSEADFQLSGQQQEDIATAFVNSARPSVEQTLAAFNCYACHGPIDPGRDPFFGFSDPAAVALGDEGRIPPPLDGVGRKLTPHWLEKILVHGEGEIRRTMATHMPYFGGANVGHLVEQFAAAHPPTPGVKMDISGHQRHHRAPYGRAEFGTDGVSCVICHGLLGHKSLGVPGPDLTHTAARLRPNWFMEYLRNPAALRPGTRMPALLTTKTDQRIEQLWTYLKEGEQMALPKGLIGGSYALEPEEKPIVFRSFVEGAGTEAIAVGFPGGLNAVFDAHAVGWALVWRGRFLDAESTWIVRRNPPAVPLGDAVKELSILSRDVRFLGYRLDTLGVPTFLYREGAVMVEDRLQPDGQRFCRVLVRDGQRREEVIAW